MVMIFCGSEHDNIFYPRSLVAAFKRLDDIAVGNILGSNM